MIISNYQHHYEEQMFRGSKDTALSIPQGLTYLAQMIAHDIVQTTDPKCNDRLTTTPHLDLSSIYGAFDEAFDDSLFDDRACFYENKERSWDLPRSDDDIQKALIPESRNDENLVIAQLHLVWMKLHNILVRKIYSGEQISRKTKIMKARRLVTQLFQLVVITDLLPKLVPEVIHSRYFTANPKRITNLNQSRLFLFFSKAVFRFGHSMIRDNYRLRPREVRTPPTTIEQLLRRQDKNGSFTYKPPRGIHEQFRIEWDDFFGFGENINFERAFRIDTSIVSGMMRIPACLPRVVGNPGSTLEPTNIAAANLLAGSTSGLPNGVQVLEEIRTYLNDPSDKTNLELDIDIDLGNAMYKDNRRRPIGGAPLWIYVLSEAENGFEHYTHDNLGPVGSVITVDVLWQSIRDAGNSILDAGSFNDSHIQTELEAIDDYLAATAGEKLTAGPVTMARLFTLMPELNS